MYEETCVYTAGKLARPHDRGPNETIPKRTYRPPDESASVMSGPPESVDLRIYFSHVMKLAITKKTNLLHMHHQPPFLEHTTGNY